MGQKQTEVGSDFVAKEAWSGKLSQFNVWNWALEDFYLENAAECRSDLLGNMVVWNSESWTIGPAVSIHYHSAFKNLNWKHPVFHLFPLVIIYYRIQYFS